MRCWVSIREPGPVIASPCSAAYFAAMLAGLLRMLTLAALAIMPFGMGAASASPAQHATASAGAGHCDDEGKKPSRDQSDGMAGCSASCSTLIADQLPVSGPVLAPDQLADRPLARRWTSMPAETATPPPKQA